MEGIDLIIAQVKKKKEISGVSDSVIRQSILNWTKSFSNNILPKSDKEIKILVKEVRSLIRKLVGRFSIELPKNIDFSESGIAQLLNSHSSTKERLAIYPWLKELIDSLNVLHILDLGCGINPLALSTRRVIYHSVDIQESNLSIIREFNTLKGINGSVHALDLRNLKKEDLPVSDLSLILKVLDVLDSKGHKNAEHLINMLTSKYILISFSTKTLSGKSMNHPQRGWIERLATRLGYSFKFFTKENEIFYLLERTV